MSGDVCPLAGNGQLSNRPRSLYFLLLLSSVSAFFLLGTAFGQATVNESLETASLYVDGATGKDTNPGTESKPLKTIGAAAALAETNNQNSIGTKITIEAGLIRETLKLSHSSKDTNLPITFEAATNGTVIVSGATVYTGWSEYSQNHSIYTTSWTHNWGTCPQLTSCPFQQEITMRQELIAVMGPGVDPGVIADANAGRHVLRGRNCQPRLCLARYRN